MNQVYLEDYTGPLYAFIEFKVGNLTVTTASEGYSTFESGEQYSLDHVTTFENGDTYISNVVMSFSYTKNSSSNRGGQSWGIGQEFNITVFDESAVYVEDIIANALANTSMGANCYIEYGWSANGKKIEERCCKFEGLLQEYTLSFEGSSTTISITGTTTSVVYMATTYLGDDLGDIKLPYEVTRTGNPAEIVRYIANEVLSNNGDGIRYTFDESTIVSTKQVIPHKDTNTPRNFACNGKSLNSYISEDLCPNAESEDGKRGYIFYILPDEEDKNLCWVYFRPQDSVDNVYGTVDEDGNTIVDLSEAGNNSGDVTRVYNYYAGFQRGEVLSYSSEFRGFAVSAGAKFTSAVDSNTNELVACEVSKISDSGTFVSPSSASRVMGMSASSYAGLDQAMRDLWNKYATQVYGASLEVMGDPNINVMDIIKLNVYTKFNLLHHTTGEYIVTCVEDSVDSSGFTTSLTLQRKGAVSEFSTSALSEGVFQEGDSAINYSTDPRFKGTEKSVKYGSKEYEEITNKAKTPQTPSAINYDNDAGGAYSVPKTTSGSGHSRGVENKTGKSSTSYKDIDINSKGSSDVASPLVYE